MTVLAPFWAVSGTCVVVPSFVDSALDPLHMANEAASTRAVTSTGDVIFIGRAGASPPSRTTGPRCLYVYVFMYLCIYVFMYRVPDTVNF